MSGSNSHNNDFQIIKNDLEKFLRSHREASLSIFGIVDKSLISAEPEQINCLPFTDYFNIFKIIANHDICVVPLISNLFNDAKSNIKYIEAGIAGIPVAASDVLEFKSCIKHSETGFLINSNQPLHNILEYAYDNRKNLVKIGENARKDVMENYTSNQIETYFVDLFQTR
jgi:glycosyltransferase involved in cell wall biosynthesis